MLRKTSSSSQKPKKRRELIFTPRKENRANQNTRPPQFSFTNSGASPKDDISPHAGGKGGLSPPVRNPSTNNVAFTPRMLGLPPIGSRRSRENSTEESNDQQVFMTGSGSLNQARRKFEIGEEIHTRIIYKPHSRDNSGEIMWVDAKVEHVHPDGSLDIEVAEPAKHRVAQYAVHVPPKFARHLHNPDDFSSDSDSSSSSSDSEFGKGWTDREVTETMHKWDMSIVDFERALRASVASEEVLHQIREKGRGSVIFRPRDNSVVITKKGREKKTDNHKYINQYLLSHTLGSGSFGKVKKAIDILTKKVYAIKIIDMSRLNKKNKIGGRPGGGRNRGLGLQRDVFSEQPPSRHQKKPSYSAIFTPRRRSTLCSLGSFGKEVAIMKKIDHHNCCRLFEVIHDKDNDKLYMVLEYHPKGAVMKGDSKQDPLEPTLIWNYARDIMFGLEYLHKSRVYHQDLKPENLLIGVDNHLKISDFGVSDILIAESRTQVLQGTPSFHAPETINNNDFLAWPVDIWGMGVTLYMFVTGICPFADRTLQKTYDKILNFHPPIDELDISDCFKDLLSKLLEKDPGKRITIKEMKEHPYITKDNNAPCNNRILPVLVSREEENEAISNNLGNILDENVLAMIKAVSDRKKRREALRSPFSPKCSMLAEESDEMTFSFPESTAHLEIMEELGESMRDSFIPKRKGVVYSSDRPEKVDLDLFPKPSYSRNITAPPY